ncbi:MAG TPA: ABC transporter permease, partial [Bryobacteraceae bacterium]|nr:ABC transporter permease [Bryobacteraceae bacterium]
MASNASLAEAASVAVGSLRGSKLRSFLTLLGIILATTTLIVVMAIINGMDRYIAEQVSDMGVDGFRIRRIVMIGESDPKKWAILDKRNPELTRDEFAFVKANAKLVRDIGMESGWSVKVKYANQTLDWIRCQGVTPNIGSISNAQVASGRFIGDTDDRPRRQVAFIG